MSARRRRRARRSRSGAAFGGEARDRGDRAGRLSSNVGDDLQLDSLERLRPVLDAVAAVGRSSGVYLVGGTVRDILLREPGFDVDLAVEGDGQAFAQALAQELAGSASRMTPSARPSSSTATASTSTWSPPAASVTTRRRCCRPSSLRRPGRPLPPRFRHQRDGGRADGRGRRPARRPVRGQARPGARTIRVLHDGSFVDDPTRSSGRFATRAATASSWTSTPPARP